MYGSSLRMETRRPRALRIRPTLAAVMPLPREEVTPPVTKTYFAMDQVLRGGFSNATGWSLGRRIAPRKWLAISSAGRWPRSGRRIPQALAPYLGPAEEWAPPRPGQTRRVGGPRAERLRQPLLDLAELGPAAERPTRLDTDADEAALGPDDVAVTGGVAVALSVPDEDDRPLGGLVGKHAIALTGPAHEAGRIAIRESHGRASPVKGRPGAYHRQLPHAERLECRPDEEAEPVRHDLDGDAGRLRQPDEWHEPGIVRLGSGSRQDRLERDVHQRHLELDEPPRAELTGIICGDLGLPDAGHVLGHDRVGNVGLRDGPVVIDQDRDRRRAWHQGRDRRRGAVGSGQVIHPAPPVTARRSRAPGIHAVPSAASRGAGGRRRPG